MKLHFKSVATVSALIFFALALTLIFAPDRLLARWGLDVTLAVEVVCRRAAALFAGVGVMLFAARNAEPSVARSALVKGVVAASALLAALGLFELKMGNVTPGILTAVFVELALILAFVCAGRGQAAVPAFNKKPGRQS